jgi:hypothetical protein
LKHFSFSWYGFQAEGEKMRLANPASRYRRQLNGFFDQNPVFATVLHGFSVYLCTVKIGYLIFTVFVFILAVYPCRDAKTCLDEQRSGISEVSAANHSHSDQEKDLCSPFCICSCCAAHIRLTSSPEIDFTSLFHNSELHSFYWEKPFLNNGQSIWQPPKLS